jgi:hypothetical protein
MNYIKHLTGFFDKVTRDDNLNPTHISLYVSLFQFWNVQRFKNPISISRDEVMRVSKICSKATYHKCMKDLHNFSYINYDPSFNPYRGSLITLFNLELTHEQVQKKVRSNTKILPTTEQALNKHQTSTEQALVPYTNNTNLVNNLNSLNSLNEGTQSKTKKIKTISDDNSKSNSKSEQESERKKVAAKKESRAKPRPERPLLEEIKNYFAQNNYPSVEADKFYNHYESNGWLVGGKTPMKNWKASANNWILNSNKFNDGKANSTNNKTDNRAGNLQTTTGKNYSEPL